MTNDLNQTVEYEYDNAGRIILQRNDDGSVIDFEYDPNGKLTSVKPPGRAKHNFVYGAGNEFLQELTPPDLAGIADESTYYFYDDDGVITRLRRPSGVELTYTYEPNTTKLLSVSDGTNTRTYNQYDTSGRLYDVTSNDGLRSELNWPGISILGDTLHDEVSGTSYGRVEFNYYQFRMTSLTLFTKNDSYEGEITFDYDNDHLITQVGDLTITRAPTTGFVSSMDIGNLAESFGYDLFGDLNTYTALENSNALYSYSVTRDDLGRIHHFAETVQGTLTNYEYTYDNRNRLSEVKTNGVVTSNSTFGANSSRTSGSVTGTPFTATYDGQDRLLTWNDLSFAYNDNGELASKTNTTTSDVTSYTWDSWGKLKTVTLPNSDVISYQYDGFGRKAKVLYNGNVEYILLYQEQLKPTAQMNSNGEMIALFAWGSKANVPEYMVKNDTTYRFITDPRGSVRLVVNVSDGNIIQRINYDEWGKVTLDTNPGFQPFGYAGGLYDHRTGLTEFGARHYDAEVGKWISKDPIGFAGGDSNLYSYTFSDPINYIDPTGMVGDEVFTMPRTDGGNRFLAGSLLVVSGGFIASQGYAALNNPFVTVTPQGRILGASALIVGTAMTFYGGKMILNDGIETINKSIRDPLRSFGVVNSEKPSSILCAR